MRQPSARDHFSSLATAGPCVWHWGASRRRHGCGQRARGPHTDPEPPSWLGARSPPGPAGRLYEGRA